MKIKSTIVLTGFICLLLGVYLGSRELKVPRFFQIKPVSQVDQIKANLRSIMVSVATVASSGGRYSYPVTLDEIKVKDLPDELRFFHDLDSEVGYDWIFYGEHVDSISIQDEELIILATPTVFNKAGEYPNPEEDTYRIIAFHDCSVKMILDTQYKNIIEKQKKLYSKQRTSRAEQ